MRRTGARGRSHAAPRGRTTYAHAPKFAVSPAAPTAAGAARVPLAWSGEAARPPCARVMLATEGVPGDATEGARTAHPHLFQERSMRPQRAGPPHPHQSSLHKHAMLGGGAARPRLHAVPCKTRSPARRCQILRACTSTILPARFHRICCLIGRRAPRCRVRLWIGPTDGASALLSAPQRGVTGREHNGDRLGCALSLLCPQIGRRA
jgi:hypothetical protein